MRFAYTYRSSDGLRHGLRPRRRPVDQAAVGKRHHLRQLAARGQIAGDVVAIGSMESKISGTPSQQAMVEIPSINVGYRLHRMLLKVLRPRPFRTGAPLRIGRTVRLDMNLLTGSVGSVPNRQMVRKGVCGRNSTPQRQGPDFRPTLHRIAVAQRVVSNPSRGSMRSVTKKSPVSKGCLLEK